MGEAVWLGILMGTGAAVAVGPILVTIIQESLAHGFAAGFRISLGAAVADAVLLIPALAASWFIARVASASLYVGLLGAALLIYLGVEAAQNAYGFWKNDESSEVDPIGNWSFWKGVLGNLLNPLTWAFWLTTGTSTILHVFETSHWSGLAVFVVVFELVLLALEASIAYAATCTQRLVGARGKAVLCGVSCVTFLWLAGMLLTDITW